MALYEELKCPYCGHKITVGNEDFDYHDDEIDIECENQDCQMEFSVTREWTPSFSAHEINYYNCKECGEEDRDSNMYLTGDDDYICNSCFTKRELKKVVSAIEDELKNYKYV